MATIPVVPATSSPGGSSGGDVSIGMPAVAAAAAAAAAGSEVPPPPREGEGGAAANPEEQLSSFVRCVASGEWAGNAFGALAFVWATVVLLGGFCSSLNRQDFWFATVLIFIESFRIFSHRYKLDSQSLFGTTRALRWRNSSFRMLLGRPQEGNGVVLILGSWLNIVSSLSFDKIIIPNAGIAVTLWVTLGMVVFVIWSWRPPRQPTKQWHMRALAFCCVLAAAKDIVGGLLLNPKAPQLPYYYPCFDRSVPYFILIVLSDIILNVAVWMHDLRPPRIADLTITPCGRKLISLAKVTSALCLASFLPLTVLFYIRSFLLFFLRTIGPFFDFFVEPFTLLVLSLGSLQKHTAGGSPFSRCTDTIMHIFYILNLLVTFPMFILLPLVPSLSTFSYAVQAVVLLLVLLLSGNLQIPAAVAQIVLSSLRLINLLVAHTDYNPLPRNSSRNMVPAIAVFYVLALCQGSLYIIASLLELLSFFPRRWLMRRSKCGAKLGAKAIDLYYEYAYATRMEMGVFGEAGSKGSFADFAIESLSSSGGSRDLQVAGLCVVHNMLQERECSSRDLTLRVTSSSAAVSTLVGMLAWTDVEDDQSYLIIRPLAARVTAELAGSLRISSIPGMLKLVSSLLNADAVVVVAPNHQQTTLAVANGGWRSWVCRFWKKMKQEYWSIPDGPDLSLTHQGSSSLPVVGMVILEKLARDLDNCAEILEDDTTNLISKTIGLIGLATSDNEPDDALVCSALEFLRRLATTGERIGAALRQELWNHPFLLTCLARVLEDDGSGRSGSSSPHQVWEPAMDIIAKLALDKEAGLQIGKIKVITARLLHAFLGRHGPNNMYYDQSLIRRIAGEALANLALWGTANCSAILDEPEHQVINNLKNMLSEDDHRDAAASLLLNICEHCSVNLLLSHPQASEHLSSALTTVMEHMMAAEGKQLESLINLASKIGDVIRETFVRELESQNNCGAELVQKLLCTLNSKKIPNPKYPRMRRVIVKILISILESCRRTVEKLMEGGMVEQLMESLTKIQRSPSRVEEYRVFYGNIGVVLEDGEPMSTLTARAKELLVQRTTQTAGTSNNRP